MVYRLTIINYYEESGCDPAENFIESTFDTLDNLKIYIYSALQAKLIQNLAGGTFFDGCGTAVDKEDIPNIIKRNIKIKDDIEEIRIIHADNYITYKCTSYEHDYCELSTIFVYHWINSTNNPFYTIKIKRDIFRWRGDRYPIIETFATKEQRIEWLKADLKNHLRHLGKYQRSILANISNITQIVGNMGSSYEYSNAEGDTISIYYNENCIMVCDSYLDDRHTIVEYISSHV